MKKLFWVYYGENPIAAVLADEWACDYEIRAKALATFEQCPCIGLEPGEAPFERKQKLLRGEIRI